MKKWYKLLKDWGTHKVGAQLQMEEADGKSLVDSGFAAEISDPTPVALDTAIKDLTKSVKDAVTAGLQEATKDINDKLAAITVGKDRSHDNPLHLRNSLGAFAKATKAFNIGKGMDPDLKAYLTELETKVPLGMNEGVGEEGGILIPDQISASIWKRAIDTVDLLGRCENIPVAGNTYTLLREKGDTMAAGVRNAGVRGYWVEEAGQITRSAPKFDRQIMRLKKLAVLVYATDEQIEDSPQSLEAFLTGKAGDEVGFMTGDALINGDGIGKPLGVLNGPCLVSVAKEAGQAADSLVTENIIKMFARCWAPSLRKASWLYNQDCLIQLLTLSLKIGTAGVPLMMPAGGLPNVPQSVILGRPAEATEWNGTIGDQGDIILADWSQYMTITKGGIKSAVSMHLRFDYDETAFRFTWRIDGMPTWAAALTPYKGSATRSSFITLDARA